MPVKLTKHMQACVELEIDGVKIVTDPGEFDHKVERVISGANAVLITHLHGDHFDQEAVTKALNENEDLKVYGPASVAEALGAFGGRVIAVKPGDEFSVGSVPVKVFGTGLHAPIHHSMPVIDNVCYLINDSIYHPGDSFDVPDAAVETLLLPTSGPWMKAGEAADFVLAVKPKTLVSIHDAIDSDIGHQLANDLLGSEGVTGIELIQVKPSKSITI